jgi:hypothetical protein
LGVQTGWLFEQSNQDNRDAFANMHYFCTPLPDFSSWYQ